MKHLENKPSIFDNSDEDVFRGYMEDLRLTPADLNKRILDVGAGSAQFSRWAKEHGVSNQIYSLELKKEYIQEKEKSVSARAEAIPFISESFDLIVSNGAIPNVLIDGGRVEAIKESVSSSVQEMMRVLRPGGEIRLGRVLIGGEYEPQRILS